MQGVTELMKGGPDFVVGEKSWLTRRRFGNVEVIRHHRFGAEQSALLDIGIHPGTPAFGRPGIIIAQE